MVKATDKLTPKRRIDLKRTFCDGCKKDISATSYSHADRLVLTTEAKTAWFIFEGLPGGVMYPESAPRPIGRDYHFCDMACLDAWQAIRSNRA